MSAGSGIGADPLAGTRRGLYRVATGAALLLALVYLALALVAWFGSQNPDGFAFCAGLSSGAAGLALGFLAMRGSASVEKRLASFEREGGASRSIRTVPGDQARQVPDDAGKEDPEGVEQEDLTGAGEGENPTPDEPADDRLVRTALAVGIAGFVGGVVGSALAGHVRNSAQAANDVR